jgi:hypothetical protein
MACPPKKAKQPKQPKQGSRHRRTVSPWGNGAKVPAHVFWLFWLFCLFRGIDPFGRGTDSRHALAAFRIGWCRKSDRRTQRFGGIHAWLPSAPFAASIAAAWRGLSRAGAQTVAWTDWTAATRVDNIFGGTATATILAPAGPVTVSYTGFVYDQSQFGLGGPNAFAFPSTYTSPQDVNAPPTDPSYLPARWRVMGRLSLWSRGPDLHRHLFIPGEQRLFRYQESEVAWNTRSV